MRVEEGDVGQDAMSEVVGHPSLVQEDGSLAFESPDDLVFAVMGNLC